MVGGAAFLFLLTASPAAAAPSFPSFPTPEEIAHALGDYFGGLVNTFIETSLPALLVSAILAVFGFIGFLMWSLVGLVFGGVNFVTQIPEQWITGLLPIQRIMARLTTLALAIVATGTVWTTVRFIFEAMVGRPWSRLLRFYVRQAIAGSLIVFAGGAITWLLRFSNALTASLLDPFNGVAGLTPSFDGFTAVGAMLIVYGFALLRFAVRRAKLVVMTGLLTAVAPAAVALWCLPLEFCEEVTEKWATTLVSCILVQIPQAAALGIGAMLVASAFAGGDAGTQDTAEGVVALFMGIGSVLAAEAIPTRINRRILGRSNVGVPPGAVATAAQIGMMAAGAGFGPGMGNVAAAAGQTAVHQVNQTVARTAAASAAANAPRVQSVLGATGGAIKMLPPPKP